MGASDAGYLHQVADTAPSGSADDAARDGGQVDGGRDDGMRDARDARTTDACDGLEMGAHTGDGHPTPRGGGEASAATGGPGCTYPPIPPISRISTFPMTAQSRPAAPMAIRSPAPPLPARLVRPSVGAR